MIDVRDDGEIADYVKVGIMDSRYGADSCAGQWAGRLVSRLILGA